MAYNRRRYKSRREKLKQHQRNTKILMIFALLAICVILYKNRWPIYDWIRISYF